MAVIALVCMPSRFSRVQLFATPWTVARQARCPWDSVGKNTGWVAMPFSRGNLPDPGIEPATLMSIGKLYWQMGSLPLVPAGKPLVALGCLYLGFNKWQLLFLLFLLNLTQFFPGQFLEPPSRESWRGLHTLSRHVPPPLLELTCVCFISSTILIQHLLNNSHYALLIEQAAWRKPVGGKELQLICTFIKQIDF